eukprot:2035811-Rhodomonas_salina.3
MLGVVCMLSMTNTSVAVLSFILLAKGAERDLAGSVDVTSMSAPHEHFEPASLPLPSAPLTPL